MTALHSPRLTDPPTAIEPLAVGAEDAAQMFGVGLRSWRRWDAAGRCPRGYMLGRRRLYRLADLRSWAAAGFPRRAEFELMTRSEPR